MRLYAAGGWLALTALHAVLVIPSPVGPGGPIDPTYVGSPREAALRKALSEISGDDSVCTQDNVLPIGSGSSTSSDLGSLKNADGSPFDKSHINPNFGKPVAYQPPRSFRFGAKVTF